MSVIYQAKRAAALTNPTSATVFVTAADSTKAALAYIPASSKLARIPFLVRCSGRATGGTTTNLTIAIKVGSSTTDGSNTAFISSGALAINSASGNWVVEAECVLDSTSKTIQGILYGQLNNNNVAQAAVTAVTSQDPTQAIDIPLACSAVFSASNASNVCELLEFSVSDQP